MPPVFRLRVTGAIGCTRGRGREDVRHAEFVTQNAADMFGAAGKGAQDKEQSEAIHAPDV